MGLIDRAFGVDKKSLMYARLAVEWIAVEQHYKKALEALSKKDDNFAAVSSLHRISKEITQKLAKVKTNFGFPKAVQEEIIDCLAEGTVMTTKLKDAKIGKKFKDLTFVTNDIFAGNTRPYINTRGWI